MKESCITLSDERVTCRLVITLTVLRQNVFLSLSLRVSNCSAVNYFFNHGKQIQKQMLLKVPQGLGQQLTKALPMSGMEHKQQYDWMHHSFIKSSYSVNILITSNKCQNESIHFGPVMLGALTLGSGTLLWFTFMCLESSCLELAI